MAAPLLCLRRFYGWCRFCACGVSMAGAVSVPAAFKWLTPFECLRRFYG